MSKQIKITRQFNITMTVTQVGDEKDFVPADQSACDVKARLKAMCGPDVETDVTITAEDIAKSYVEAE